MTVAKRQSKRLRTQIQKKFTNGKGMKMILAITVMWFFIKELTGIEDLQELIDILKRYD